jgi:hypothetical protein
MKSDENSNSREQFEAAAAEIIGQIVFRFSSLEFNLGLCLRSLVSGADKEALNPLVKRLGFKSKLDALKEVFEYRFSTNSEAVNEFCGWYQHMDEFRVRRNSFIHGRWGVLFSDWQVVNVASGMPGSEPQKEVRYTLEELGAELKKIDELINSFDKLRGKWSI